MLTFTSYFLGGTPLPHTTHGRPTHLPKLKTFTKSGCNLPLTPLLLTDPAFKCLTLHCIHVKLLYMSKYIYCRNVICIIPLYRCQIKPELLLLLFQACFTSQLSNITFYITILNLMLKHRWEASACRLCLGSRLA